MLSINQIIDLNKSETDSPFFMINRDQKIAQQKVIITNIIQREAFGCSPDSVSRDIIQRFNNFLCQLNQMQLYLECEYIETIFKESERWFNLASLINHRFGTFGFMNHFLVDKLIIERHLSQLKLMLKSDVSHLLKIEEQVAENEALLNQQREIFKDMILQYQADLTERKVAANNIIHGVFDGGETSDEEKMIVNAAYELNFFEDKFMGYSVAYDEFSQSMLDSFSSIKRELRTLSVNASSLIDMIYSAELSKDKSFILEPTMSFEADLATYARKSFKGELPVHILYALVKTHVSLMIESNSNIIALSQEIDVQSQLFGEELIHSIQPYVKNELIKVSAESMIRTQREYEYDCES
ncbi:hypothetical protein [Photobacterium galatheae]|uniref:Uncharacterized protein n=1 Tax=Photobacterium galatheae TaxID=1654360 RepID=A0A066RKJ5_9GAMM|nr:hypothetical protein [Photobacterium galatheae]KDM90975.1 hypothetical protein EA58_14565 [Photobacterium galatheae]MCM0149068.1 hypothetical protein [Photobacterium galatheae]